MNVPDDMPAERERTTTASLYVSDLQRLRRYQLDHQGDDGRWLPMPDIVRKILGRLAELEGSDA